MSIPCSLERHPGNHRGVPERLQFEMPAILFGLQLDDDEVRLLIQSEKVDTTSAVFPFTELLTQEERLRCNDLYVVSK